MRSFVVFLLFVSNGYLFCAANESCEVARAKQKRMCLVVPAFNEEHRIGPMLDSYNFYFQEHPLQAELLVVLNGCTDNTKSVVQERLPESAVSFMELEQAGKGRAVKQGFIEALKRQPAYDYIGFVDADGATGPEAFYELVQTLETNSDIDGAIASRYMEGSECTVRPFVKKWGQRACFLPLICCLFGMDYHDTQCGAKVFKKEVLDSVASCMGEPGWSFDVELLYLARNAGFAVVEQPTHWEDQEGSHLDTCCNGMPMLCSLCAIRANFCCK